MACLCGKKRVNIRNANAGLRSARSANFHNREQQIMDSMGPTKSEADRKRKKEILKRKGRI